MGRRKGRGQNERNPNTYVYICKFIQMQPFIPRFLFQYINISKLYLYYSCVKSGFFFIPLVTLFSLITMYAIIYTYTILATRWCFLEWSNILTPTANSKLCSILSAVSCCIHMDVKIDGFDIISARGCQLYQVVVFIITP